MWVSEEEWSRPVQHRPQRWPVSGAGAAVRTMTRPSTLQRARAHSGERQLRCHIPRAAECPWRAQYPFLGVMARPLLRAVQCARAWHDLTLHTADVEIALR